MFTDGLTYQDSRMAWKEEYLSGLESFSLKDREAKSSGGPVVFQDGGKVFTESGDSHTMIIGDTGSMKTLRFVLPLIYSCAKAEESMVIVDPKGELAIKSNLFLKEQGYSIKIINLRKPQLSPDQWNPMDRVKRSWESGKDGQENAIIQLNDLLQTLFFSRSTADKDKYWNESAGQLALGICELIALLGEELSVKNLLYWRYENLPNGTLRNYFDSLPARNPVYQNLAGYMNLTAENTKSCILSTFDQLVRVFKSSPALTRMLSKSSIDMDCIGVEKTAIFLVVPDEKTTFHFLATLFISQCYEALLEKADEYGGGLPRRVNFILEEFCNMPKLPDLLAMLTAARSRNIRFHLVIQSYEQMVDKYGDHVSKTAMDNCGTLIYLHSRELSFLYYISQLAGTNEFGRPLLSVSRLQRIKKNETLIFRDRCYPYLAQDIPLIFEYPITLGDHLPTNEDVPVGCPDARRSAATNSEGKWRNIA